MIRSAMAVLISIAAVSAPAPQRATFSSRLEAVRLDVSVTRRGKPVNGLTAGDFDVFDNGVRQDVALIASEEIPLDLVLALDMSGSVTGERLDELRTASQVALEALAKDEKAALLTFSERVSIRSALAGDLGAVRAAMAGVEFPGNTSLVDASYVALAQADAGTGRGVAIVFSDGVDTGSWLTAASVIESAKRLDVVLFGVSTDAARGSVLEELADASGGDLIRIRSTRELRATLDALLKAFRQRYLLSFVPRNVPRGRWHTLKVRVKQPAATVKARAGYFGS